MMKISQVAKKYKLSIDTINYYVSYGLLVPSRRGVHRVFDERTLSDLEIILQLRDMDFSLQEIHKILSLYRISALSSKQDTAELCSIYTQKKEHCLMEQERLSQIINDLETRIDALDSHNAADESPIGLPVSMLNLLCCPVCGRTFDILDVNMNQRYIFSGSLRCECGYKAGIKNGILLTPNKNQDVYDKPDINRDTYKDLPPHLISLFQASYNWMIRQLGKLNLSGKVVLETHVNAWFFMHNHQEYLDPNGRYIIIDKYPETLSMYKKLIDQQGYERDILYIADSSFSWPLKQNIVSLNIDFFAANEHFFYNETFLFEDIKKYLVHDALMLGTYFYFMNGFESMRRLLSEYPTCSKNNFNLAFFEKEIVRTGFQVLEREDSGFTTKSGNNIGFSFHNDGEKMYLMPYLAKLLDKH